MNRIRPAGEAADGGLLHRTAGLSLIEVIIALMIVGVIAGIAVPSYNTFRRNAERAVCLSHMRTIHAGLGTYLVENRRWPQMPEEALQYDEGQFYEWWIFIMEPYGIASDTWMCPSDKVRKGVANREATGSYLPTLFDWRPDTPYKWPQPWLLERGNLHGQGAHIAMPDGAIEPSFSAFPGR